MELIDLVSELLYKHNCVIIPGFGGFVGNFKSTDFDQNRLLISPSRKKVVFNQSLIENDGLLINGLMAKKELSYNQAEKEVLLFTKFLKDRLEKYKNYEFKNIGSLYLNKENALIFVAYNGVNFHKKSFGLQDIKVKRLQVVLHDEKHLSLHKETIEDGKPKVIPITTSKRKRAFYIPQVAASLSILVIFGVVLWQLLQSSAKRELANEPLLEHKAPESNASIIPDLLPSEDSSNPTDDYLLGETDADSFTGQVTETLEFKDVTKDVIKDATPIESTVAETWTPEIDIEEEVLNPIDMEKTVVEKEYPFPTLKKENVYYIAVAKNYTEKVKNFKHRKLEKLEYELFEVEIDGTKLLCLDKFISAKNAQDYLNLVKKYDDRYAFIFENLE